MGPVPTYSLRTGASYTNVPLAPLLSSLVLVRRAQAMSSQRSSCRHKAVPSLLPLSAVSLSLLVNRLYSIARRDISPLRPVSLSPASESVSTPTEAGYGHGSQRLAGV